jgi:hypothetical protein
MAGTIVIDYAEVYSKTAELRVRIAADMEQMEAEYSYIQSMLNGVDGANNTALKEAMGSNPNELGACCLHY